jgi:hypothetical protein
MDIDWWRLRQDYFVATQRRQSADQEARASNARSLNECPTVHSHGRSAPRWFLENGNADSCEPTAYSEKRFGTRG